jgi:RNA polymerase subunit RPABC4/transcription elongation factor Spt4
MKVKIEDLYCRMCHKMVVAEDKQNQCSCDDFLRNWFPVGIVAVYQEEKV